MELYLVEFKGSRRQFYLNPENLPLKPGNFVIVQAERGEDLGEVTKKLEVEDPSSYVEKPFDILRSATQEDLERLKGNKERGEKALEECQKLIQERNLEMKLVDVEYKCEGRKLS